MIDTAHRQYVGELIEWGRPYFWRLFRQKYREVRPHFGLIASVWLALPKRRASIRIKPFFEGES